MDLNWKSASRCKENLAVSITSMVEAESEIKGLYTLDLFGINDPIKNSLK